MVSRQKDIKKLFKKLKKRYPESPAVLSRDRKILEHIVFAIFLEDVPFETARAAFVAMERYFIDWNEIRVSTANEIADALGGTIPASRALLVGERLRRLLQWVFDATYKFDLEDVRSKGRDETFEFVSSIPFATPFVAAYVSLFAFGVGDVPLDEGAWRALRLLDFARVSEDKREIAPDVDGAFDDGEKLEFFALLHALGAELIDDSTREGALNFLKTFDPASAERSSERSPEVAPIGPTDPREIARLVAKQEKRQKRPSTSMIDESDLLEEAFDGDESDEAEELLDKAAGESVDFEADFHSDAESDEDDFGGRGSAKKTRVRKDSFDRGASRETSLSRNGASYSEYCSERDEKTPLLGCNGEPPNAGRKERSKPKKKRADEGDGADDERPPASGERKKTTKTTPANDGAVEKVEKMDASRRSEDDSDDGDLRRELPR